MGFRGPTPSTAGLPRDPRPENEYKPAISWRYTLRMWESCKQFVISVLKHWYQSLGGAGMAIVALLADIWDWRLPPRLWLILSGLLFFWAIFLAFHELRLQGCTTAWSMNSTR